MVSYDKVILKRLRFKGDAPAPTISASEIGLAPAEEGDTLPKFVVHSFIENIRVIAFILTKCTGLILRKTIWKRAKQNRGVEMNWW